MQLQFFGATDTVTGSRTLVSHGGRSLLVDCGLFQGLKRNRLRNWDPLELPPLDGLLLTHAHLDHSGWVPRLIAQGYDGPVFCTPGTASLLEVLWPDAGRIQEEDAERANRRGSSRHPRALPLYDERAARLALRSLQTVPFGEALELGPFDVRFQRAGHILGAAGVTVRTAAASVHFSGDVGRPVDPVMPAPAPPPAVDTLVLESTYGDRLHPDSGTAELLADVLRRTFARGGMVLIPSFAVGRAQTLMWLLHDLFESGALERVPVLVDSPMATAATERVLAHPEDVRLTPAQLQAMTEQVIFVGDPDESRAVDSRRGPFVLIAASGMLTGGRVLHHLRSRAPDAKNTLLFVGFQAAGTRGGRIVAGERTIRMYGDDVAIACEVAQIGGFSAHGDHRELIAWVKSAPEPPGTILLNHGEPEPSDAFRQRLQREGFHAQVATEQAEWDVRSGRRRPLGVEPLAFASLLFEGDDDATARAVELLLARIQSGESPPRRVVVRGALVERLRELLPPSAFDQLVIEPAPAAP